MKRVSAWHPSLKMFQVAVLRPDHYVKFSDGLTVYESLIEYEVL